MNNYLDIKYVTDPHELGQLIHNDMASKTYTTVTNKFYYGNYNSVRIETNDNVRYFSVDRELVYYALHFAAPEKVAALLVLEPKLAHLVKYVPGYDKQHKGE